MPERMLLYLAQASGEWGEGLLGGRQSAVMCSEKLTGHKVLFQRGRDPDMAH